MQIYVSKSGQRYGPYAVPELRAAVLSNVFRPEHFASCDDGRTWRPISEVPGLGSIAYTVESDAEGGLLVIRYRDRVVAEDVECCTEEVADALAIMPSGFRLLVDLTGLESMDVACVPHLEKIMKLCNAKGVSGVVRVVPDKRRDIGLQIMSYFHYGPNVRIFTCKNMDEATAILARITQDPACAVAPVDAQDE
jgi:anti-anti-sigma regulatory factor